MARARRFRLWGLQNDLDDLVQATALTLIELVVRDPSLMRRLVEPPVRQSLVWRCLVNKSREFVRANSKRATQLAEEVSSSRPTPDEICGLVESFRSLASTPDFKIISDVLTDRKRLKGLAASRATSTRTAQRLVLKRLAQLRRHGSPGGGP